MGWARVRGLTTRGTPTLVRAIVKLAEFIAGWSGWIDVEGGAIPEEQRLLEYSRQFAKDYVVEYMDEEVGWLWKGTWRVGRRLVRFRRLRGRVTNRPARDQVAWGSMTRGHHAQCTSRRGIQDTSRRAHGRRRC